MKMKRYFSIFNCIKQFCLRPIKACIILSVLMFFMAGSSCEIFMDEEANKKCEQSKWDPWDIKIHIKFYLTNSEPIPKHKIVEALDLQFVGTIRNLDCRGYEEGYFDIDSTIFPSFLFPKLSYSYLFLAHVSPYDFPFKISNFDETFTISFTMKATFKDGVVLQSTQVYYHSGTAQWMWTENHIRTIEIPESNVYWSLVTK